MTMEAGYLHQSVDSCVTIVHCWQMNVEEIRHTMYFIQVRTTVAWTNKKIIIQNLVVFMKKKKPKIKTNKTKYKKNQRKKVHQIKILQITKAISLHLSYIIKYILYYMYNHCHIHVTAKVYALSLSICVFVCWYL